VAFGDRGIDFIGEYMCFIIFYYTAKRILVRNSKKKIIKIFKQVIFETGKRKIFGKMWRMWRFPKFLLTISLNMCMICSVCRKFYIWNIFYFREDLRDFAKFCGKKRIFAIIEIFFVATISRKYLALLCLLGKYPCLVTKVPVEPIFPTQVGIYLQKNSPLTPLFW
jgi:hypothetical protein